MKIYELLSDESKWTRCTSARDKNGSGVASNDPDAVSWCLMGAMNKCYPSADKWEYVRVEINKKNNNSGIMRWNDAPERTYEEVYNLCKELDV